MNEIQQAVTDAIRLARVEGLREAEKRRWVKPTMKVAMAHNEARAAAAAARTKALEMLEGCHVAPF